MFKNKFRYFFAFLLSVYTYANTEFCNLYYYFHIRIEWYYAFITISAITFLILEMNSLMQPLLEKMFRPALNKLRFRIYFFMISSLAASGLTILVVLVMGMVIHSYSLQQNLVPLKLNLTYSWLVSLLYHLIDAIIFYFKEYKSTRLEAEELKSVTAQAEIQLIKSQINPHFLFNNLNVLSTLILKKNEDANHFIEAFSKVYRYILTQHEKELVELRSELDFIRTYVFLLEKRFSQALVIKINVDGQQADKFIIPAGLQMLIENAIKHNVASKSRPLFINIYTKRNNVIVVSNNLQEKHLAEKTRGIGLKNIIRRYEIVSDRAVKIEKSDSFFSVSLPLINMN